MHRRQDRWKRIGSSLADSEGPVRLKRTKSISVQVNENDFDQVDAVEMEISSDNEANSSSKTIHVNPTGARRKSSTACSSNEIENGEDEEIRLRSLLLKQIENKRSKSQDNPNVVVNPGKIQSNPISLIPIQPLVVQSIPRGSIIPFSHTPPPPTIPSIIRAEEMPRPSSAPPGTAFTCILILLLWDHSIQCPKKRYR